MSFNKKILALAIAGALPGASYAGVNLQTDLTVPVFAQEIPVPITGAGLVNLGGILDVTTQLGFSIVGSSKYVRLDFPDTKLAVALVAGNFSTTDNAPAEVPALPGTLTISAGGAVGDSFVIVEISGANLSNLDQFNFAPPVNALPAGTITAMSKAPHTIIYHLYNSAIEAVNNVPGTSLSVADSTWYTFGPALNVACNTTGLTVQKIDVTDTKHFITPPFPNTFTNLFNFTASLNSSVFKQDGVAAVIGDYLPAGSTIKVTGNFSFLNGMSMDVNPINTSLFPISGTWTVGGPNPPSVLPIVSPLGVVSVTTLGLIDMVPSDYSVLVTPGAGSLNPAAIDLGVCGRLAYSGSSDRIDFGLTPNATNKQFMRITNPSATNGAVNVSVWNDAGVQVDFPLSVVKVGAAPGINLPLVLNAHSSTPLIDVNAFYAAAQAINPAFLVGSGLDGKPGKLRVEVRGAFGDDHLDGHFIVGGKASTVRLKDGIHIEAVNNGAYSITHD